MGASGSWRVLPRSAAAVFCRLGGALRSAASGSPSAIRSGRERCPPSTAVKAARVAVLIDRRRARSGVDGGEQPGTERGQRRVPCRSARRLRRRPAGRSAPRTRTGRAPARRRWATGCRSGPRPPSRTPTTVPCASVSRGIAGPSAAISALSSTSNRPGPGHDVDEALRAACHLAGAAQRRASGRFTASRRSRSEVRDTVPPVSPSGSGASQPSRACARRRRRRRCSRAAGRAPGPTTSRRRGRTPRMPAAVAGPPGRAGRRGTRNGRAPRRRWPPRPRRRRRPPSARSRGITRRPEAPVDGARGQAARAPSTRRGRGDRRGRPPAPTSAVRAPVDGAHDRPSGPAATAAPSGCPPVAASRATAPASPRVRPSGIAQCRCTPGARSNGSPNGAGGTGRTPSVSPSSTIGSTVSVGTASPPAPACDHERLHVDRHEQAGVARRAARSHESIAATLSPVRASTAKRR